MNTLVLPGHFPPCVDNPNVISVLWSTFPPKHLHFQLLPHPLSTFMYFHPNPSKASGSWTLTGKNNAVEQ